MSNILDYMPDYYLGVREMEELLKVQGKALDTSDAEQDKILANQFIGQADADGISIYEQQLGITPQAGESLEERRRTVLIENAPPIELTKNYLHNTATLYGLSLDFAVDTKNHTITVYSVGGATESQVANLTNWLNRVLPANMIYDIKISFVTQSSTLSADTALAISYVLEAMSLAEPSQTV